ncbi:unnamed protein product [Cylicostephanus goldi]|uniref:polypeptide N-acetylgalactosaminyltransferase n=1 Tax=Cylicostephanus goldi TaxID=71465 RepID=A0A3P7Q9D0_CYLGO|nr:unnamed protein product [Cylicostephanus goldi]
MAGGYFAISTKWFWELGGYDEGLDIWGGEQYELSFKISGAVCGSISNHLAIPVGHIYRCKYMPFKNAGKGDFISRNYKRVAEVWMDEYKHNLYKHRPGVGDADTELRNKAARMCVDTQFKQSQQRFGLRKCISDDPNSGGEQNLRITRWHDIRPEGRNVCFDVSTSDDKAPVVLFDCHSQKGNQLFKYRIETQMIYHPVSNQCLTAETDGSGFVFMRKCDNDSPNQKWTWQVLDEKLLNERQNAEPLEEE